jgi:hypothetical protein
MEDQSSLSKEARALSRVGASRGGRIRAERLSSADRQAIARQAAQARWGKAIASAEYAGEVRIGDRTISCAVLEDETRVINQGTLLTALGRSNRPSGGPGDNGYALFAGNLKPFISPQLANTLSTPIAYVPPTGGRAWGYPADVLPDVCDVYLDARKENRLLKSQEAAAEAAEILMRSLARVGVVALVDEATGYQDVRARNDLQRILEYYVQAELRPWLKMFPDDFFREVYRLQGWEYKPGTSKRNPAVGKLVNKYIYEQLPPGVHEELQRKNPRTPKGYRAHKHFQFLTEGTGIPHLDRQISTVTTLMRISDSKSEFENLFERAFPPTHPRLPLVLEGDVSS